jgi:hypothetical protein
MNAETQEVIFTDRGVSTEVVVIRLSGDFLLAMPKGHVATQPQTNLSYIVFHLLNFHDFRAHKVSFATEDKDVGTGDRISLETNDWIVTVDSLPNTAHTIEELKSAGGYAITHVGKLSRTDQRAFTTEKARDLLSALHTLFSFVRGFWTPPVLSVGFNAQDERVWEEWSIRYTHRWQDSFTWFSERRAADILSSFFPGFLERWHDPVWCDALRQAIHLYVVSNTHAGGTTEGAIILTQSALELLSWVTLVEAKQSLTREGFNRLTAEDQIRLLLSQSRIPLEIPTELVELIKIAKEFNYMDGPDALTRIRNAYVHPGAKQRNRFSPTIFEAWNFSLWYLELALLHLCEYHGEYENRLKLQHWKGQTEQVPWNI